MNDGEHAIEVESMRAVVHELRNISFGLEMTVDEITTAAPPDEESVRHLRRLASRISEMADIVHQLTESVNATVESVRIDVVLEALGERFPESSLVRIGPRDLVARGDAQLLLRALAQLVPVHTDEQVDITIAVSTDHDGVHIEIGNATLRRSLGAELARRLIRLQGGRFALRQDRPAFVVTLPHAQDGVP